MGQERILPRPYLRLLLLAALLGLASAVIRLSFWYKFMKVKR
jgi:hypothetical protein